MTMVMRLDEGEEEMCAVCDVEREAGRVQRFGMPACFDLERACCLTPRPTSPHAN
jgi:hypothetical protein